MKRSTLFKESGTSVIATNSSLTLEEKKDFMCHFADFCHNRPQEDVDKFVIDLLNELYGFSLARGMKFLFDNVDMPVKQRFLNTYLDPEALACHVFSSIEVTPTCPDERLTPNIGRFVVSIRTPDGEKKQLRFANQVSTVYYLMYLIDRKQKEGDLPVIDLARNMGPFVSLYHAVYDKITHTAAKLHHQKLLYRVDDGKIRAGSKSKVECDIRQHLAEAFFTIGDSPVPYGMSSRRHLSVSPDKITFVGTASRLLYLQFI